MRFFSFFDWLISIVILLSGPALVSDSESEELWSWNLTPFMQDSSVKPLF